MRCHFIPPYLLRRIAAAADDRFAGRCGEVTLAVDSRIRAARQVAPAQLLTVAPAGAGSRIIHTANNTEILPGEVMRTDGDPPVGDAAVDEAFDSSGQVLQVFAEQFDRRSVDGQGSTLSVTVHYGINYDNAFWDGSQLVFGDGDGVIFERFTKPPDVMFHEFTHGVIQFTAALAYQGQSGALNESVSDVFAAITKQFVAGQRADQATWLIGEGLFRPTVNAIALRSMREPGTAYDDPQIGKDPQVGTMADFVETTEDNGGVHINSGIPNRAFALTALEIGGFSWEKAGQIWYDALTAGELTPRSDFAAFAQATLNSAARRFPGESEVTDAVRRGWEAVGVLAIPAPARQHRSGSGREPTPVGPMIGGAPPEPPGEGSPEKVAVRRSGGFAGGVRSAELDLNEDPEGPEVRQLLMQASVQQLSISEPGPDRFVYTVRYGSWEWTVGEQDLTPELRRVVQIVLTRGG
jgi:hypothetical protein